MSIRKDALPIAKNKGYYVDNNGNVFSPKKQLKLVKCSNRYSFSIRVNGKRTSIQVHVFVAYFKFGNDIFKEGFEIRHLDDDSLNNSWINIGIGTHKENCKDTPKIKRSILSIQSSANNRRFTDEEVNNIIKDNINGLSYKKLCVKYNTSKSTLSYLFNHAYYSGKKIIK